MFAAIFRECGYHLYHATANSVGFDIKSPISIEIKRGETRYIPAGISLKMPNNMWAQILTKSSFAQRGITTLGGVIDPDYTGEIGVLLHYLYFSGDGNNFLSAAARPDHTYSKPDKIKIERGDKIAQIVFHKAIIPKITYDSIEQVISDAVRGDRGFGQCDDEDVVMVVAPQKRRCPERGTIEAVVEALSPSSLDTSSSSKAQQCVTPTAPTMQPMTSPSPSTSSLPDRLPTSSSGKTRIVRTPAVKSATSGIGSVVMAGLFGPPGASTVVRAADSGTML